MTISAERNILYMTVRKLSATLTVNTRVALRMAGVETMQITATVIDVSTTEVCPSLLIKTIWMCTLNQRISVR